MYPTRRRLERLERHLRRTHGVLWVLMDGEVPELHEPYIVQQPGETIEQARARHTVHHPEDADRLTLPVFGFEAEALEGGAKW